MYLLPAFLSAPRVHATEPFLQRALDASVDEPARVAAVRQLHGVPKRARVDVARRLVSVLNEPLWWLPSEALSFVWLSGVLVGVAGGRFSACTHDVVGDAVGELHCPVLGRVVAAHAVRQLGGIVEDLPWMRAAQRGAL